VKELDASVGHLIDVGADDLAAGGAAVGRAVVVGDVVVPCSRPAGGSDTDAGISE
jgi:hypothetical protein